MEKETKSDLSEIQINKLFDIINYAKKNSSFYKMYQKAR